VGEHHPCARLVSQSEKLGSIVHWLRTRRMALLQVLPQLSVPFSRTDRRPPTLSFIPRPHTLLSRHPRVPTRTQTPPRGTLHAPTPAHDECAAEDLRPREGHPWERGEGQGAHGDPELRRKQGGELPRLACGLKRVCLRVLSVPTSPSIHTHLNAPTHRLVALAPPSLSASSLPAPVLPPNRHPCA